jgi:RNA polymerase sigma factor (sigma-70 family)
VTDHSVTLWLRQLADGDQVAAQKLWERYGKSLTRYARRRFQSVFSPAEDEEDLVQSVFRVLWAGATQGRFDDVENRDELWWLMLAITRRRALNRQAYNQRQKRGTVTVPLNGPADGDGHASDFAANLAGSHPPPELILMLSEQQQRLFAMLRDDVLRSIAQLRLEGYTHEEIARKLDVTPRTVIRKVNLIREQWSQELHV